jgi:hypothetical protein
MISNQLELNVNLTITSHNIGRFNGKENRSGRKDGKRSGFDSGDSRENSNRIHTTGTSECKTEVGRGVWVMRVGVLCVCHVVCVCVCVCVCV